MPTATTITRGKIGTVKEVKKNDLYGANFGAFHIKMRNGQNYNLAAVTPNNFPVDAGSIIETLNSAR